MKLRYLIITFCAFAASLFVSCSKEDNLNVPLLLEGDTWEPGQVDNWLYDNFTKPYNIQVKYRWDPFEVNYSKTLVPPMEDKVIPTMEAVKKIWIEPYVAEAGDMFIKRYAPKQYVLVGSAEYQNDGTIVLGQAEGGRKVTLMVLNQFDKKNLPVVKQMLHTIEHEFAHILHQTILYPREYKQITPSGYTASWYNTEDEEARELGFITAYSRANADEDFVEMVSTMLTEGKVGFDALVNNVGSETGKSFLRKKEAMVASYFQNSWGINIYSLQTRTELAIKELNK